MPNFFTENQDILFQFENINIQEIVQIIENDYKEINDYNYAPADYADAMENYKKILEIAGDIAGNFIAPRAAKVDEEGAIIENGKTIYAKGTQENLKQLTDAELMSVEFARKYGGLNFPKTIYLMMVEMVSRADASLMNIFGLQDIAKTIEKFGDEEIKNEYLPG